MVSTKQGWLLFDADDLANLIREEFGDEPEEYFRDLTSPEKVLDGVKLQDYCTGECDRVYSTQEHYTNIILDLVEELRSWDTEKHTKQATDLFLKKLARDYERKAL